MRPESRASIGFGDVRIAALGGLGLGHASLTGVTLGVGGFAIHITAQAVSTLARTRDRNATFACGQRWRSASWSQQRSDLLGPLWGRPGGLRRSMPRTRPVVT